MFLIVKIANSDSRPNFRFIVIFKENKKKQRARTKLNLLSPQFIQVSNFQLNKLRFLRYS